MPLFRNNTDDAPRPYDPYLDDDLYRPVDREADLPDLTVTGQLPDDLVGTFAQIGPNPQYKTPNYNWFDGDGMIHGVKFTPGLAPRYLSKQVDTAARRRERSAGKSLHTGLNSPFSLQNFSSLRHGEFLKNTANTALVPFRQQLLATWYGGARPYNLNPEDFSTLGQEDFHGTMKRGMIAHPKIDPQTGELIYLDRSFVSSLVSKTIYHQVVKPSGEAATPIAIELLRPEAMHDFAITKNHSVILDFPLRTMIKKGPGWRDETRSRIGILPRRAGPDAKVQWFETSNNVCLHVVNAFESDHKVILVAAELEDFVKGIAYLYRWEINLKTGEVAEGLVDDEAMEFPRINDQFTGVSNRYAYVPMVADKPTFLFDRLRKYDFGDHSGQSRVVVNKNLATDCFGSEPVFVPRPGDDRREDDGYVLNLIHNRQENCAFLDVLAAENLEQLARVEIPTRIPVGFHCAFLPA